MTIDRRFVISAGAGLGFVAATVAAASAKAKPTRNKTRSATNKAEIDTGIIGTTGVGYRGYDSGLVSGSKRDQTRVLQDVIDRASKAGVPVRLPPGRFVVGTIELREGTRLVGANGLSTLVFGGGASFIVAEAVDDVRLEGLTLDGGGLAQELVAVRSCRNLVLVDLKLRGGRGNGIGLSKSSGRVSQCEISNIGKAGVFSLDAVGLVISGNTVRDCANNGILVWRSKPGEDGTIVTGNRISKISASDGGSGENGNGVNVFRADGVMISNNRISDCAYSAVRGNSASNIQIVDNTCTRIGEVALYAEFGFQGAVISSNIVDTAASGISVTNFNEGGRLAVVQGNLVRNLFRREHEPQDKRGEGISVEADASVTGNTIEGAASAGMTIGFGKYMRDVVASNNVIRDSRYGILVSSNRLAGACLISSNLISGARDGAIRAAERGRAYGPELATTSTVTERVSITGNIVA